VRVREIKDGERDREKARGRVCDFTVIQSRARAAGKKHPKKRGQRATSNIFAMFDQAQIQEFKEVKSLVKLEVRVGYRPSQRNCSLTLRLST